MIHISSRRVQALISALAMLSLLLIPAIAKANGTPIRVRMAYQPPLSNAGPQDATGTIEIAFTDGEVHGDIEGLTPGPEILYEVWLYDRETEDILSLTTFEADASGITRFDALFDEPIPEDGWDAVVITIEDDPDSSPEPDSRWSLVGTFADAEIVEDVTPEVLPETGSRSGPSEDAARYAGLVLGGAVAAGLAIALIVPAPSREENR